MHIKKMFDLSQLDLSQFYCYKWAQENLEGAKWYISTLSRYLWHQHCTDLIAHTFLGCTDKYFFSTLIFFPHFQHYIKLRTFYLTNLEKWDKRVVWNICSKNQKYYHLSMAAYLLLVLLVLLVLTALSVIEKTERAGKAKAPAFSPINLKAEWL